MNISFPLSVAGSGRTQTDSDHIAELIEQVLFTTPGERPHRPDFGTGLSELVFAPADDEMLGATQMMVQASLQQWLGDLIEVDSVRVGFHDETLNVTVRYRERRSRQAHTAQFQAN